MVQCASLIDALRELPAGLMPIYTKGKFVGAVGRLAIFVDREPSGRSCRGLVSI